MKTEKEGVCVVDGCSAKKKLVTGKNGKKYWKYDVLIMEQNHKHEWVKND